MTVQCYNHNTKSLEKPVEYKVKRILELSRLVKETETRWICLPIPDYNSTTYTLNKIPEGWSCNCQGYGKRRSCSHERALILFLRSIGDKSQLDLFS